jgi:hypothetical protein
MVFLILLDGMRMSPLRTSDTNWSIVPALDDRWDLGSWSNEIWQGNPKYLEKTYLSAILCTKNPTWPDLWPNPGRRDRKQAANRLSYGTILVK